MPVWGLTPILKHLATEMSAPKRKHDQENRIFQARWETDYLFTEFKGRPMCLVCLETKSAMKDYNLSRHNNTTHKEKSEKYTGAARAAIVADLKGKIHRQQNIFNTVKAVVNEHGGFSKLSAIVTNGTPSMQGRRTGFAGLLHQSGVDCPVLHCIIHQEALCAKTINFSHVMDLVTKVTSLIQGGNRALNHRKFVAFLEEVNAAYGDLQMHTDIRWMSRGKCLERFFALRTELPVFSEDCVHCDTSAYCRKLQDTAFLCNMAFLSDITSHLNHLNIQLQGRCQTVSDLYAYMSAFRRKLALFRDGFSCTSPNLSHFPSCEEMRRDVPECEKIFPKVSMSASKTSTPWSHELFTAPLSVTVTEQPAELQLELCELQSDPFFQSQKNEKGILFWRLLPESRSPLLKDFSLSMASMFGSTYIRESNFSTMKHIKSKERNRLTDEALFQLMQIGSTKADIDIQNIVQQQGRPQVSHEDKCCSARCRRGSLFRTLLETSCGIRLCKNSSN
uniref:HAT C-terminal dimerisation domain-containing protein n=1 Tax=Stegastes partitus TaxID=144197 RepID=A0A3B4ZZY3_9TELE